MPRPRKNALFELSGQWIARIPRSPFYYRFWTEPGTGRTRCASLGTGDFESAKIIFAKAALIKGEKTPDSLLSAVLESYFLERTDKLPSKKHARLAGKTMLGFWGEKIRVGQITEAKQKAFAEWSVQKGHSLAYISRNLSVAAAAVGQAGLAVKIYFSKAEIKTRWGLQTKAPRKVFIPSDDELARYLSADLPESFRRWCMVASLTGARPEAVLELSPAQRNREAGLLDLNPPGRTQNKKFRPLVREPKALTAWLNKWERESGEAGWSAARHPSSSSRSSEESSARPAKASSAVPASPERYCVYWSVESVQTAVERARADTAIPISAYSFRHKVATVLRRARIPEDQIALQLGHKRPETGITAAYGEWSPDYLSPVAKALDAWWASIARKATVPLLARMPRRKVPVRRALRLVVNGG